MRLLKKIEKMSKAINTQRQLVASEKAKAKKILDEKFPALDNEYKLGAIHSITGSLFDGWRIDDVSLDSNGNIVFHVERTIGYRGGSIYGINTKTPIKTKECGTRVRYTEVVVEPLMRR